VLRVGAIGVDLRLRGGGFFRGRDGFRERSGLILIGGTQPRPLRLASLFTGLLLSGTALFSVEHLLFLRNKNGPRPEDGLTVGLIHK
jgi:hypothetical protein